MVLTESPIYKLLSLQGEVWGRLEHRRNFDGEFDGQGKVLVWGKPEAERTEPQAGRKAGGSS